MPDTLHSNFAPPPSKALHSNFARPSNSVHSNLCPLLKPSLVKLSPGLDFLSQAHPHLGLDLARLLKNMTLVKSSPGVKMLIVMFLCVAFKMYPTLVCTLAHFEVKGLPFYWLLSTLFFPRFWPIYRHLYLNCRIRHNVMFIGLY